MHCDGDGVERWACRLQDVGLSCDGVFRKSHRLVAHNVPTKMAICFKTDSERIPFIPVWRFKSRLSQAYAPGKLRPTGIVSFDPTNFPNDFVVTGRLFF